MTVSGDAPLGRGCALVCAPCSSAAAKRPQACCAAQRARHSDVERPRDMASRAGEPGLGRGFDLGLLAAAKTTPCERRGVQTALAPEIKTPGPGADGSRGYTRDAGEGGAPAHPTNARK